MTELIWEGKYKQGKKTSPLRVALPFQTIETVNENVQERQKMLDLFSTGAKTDWRNRLIWGDKKYVLPSMLPELAGKVNLIYIDPPFDTGADFSFTATIPDNPETEEDEETSFTKQPSILEQKAYRDTWGKGLDSYLQWFYEAAVMLRELLAENGSIYVHLDWHVVHYAKAILDEVFGSDNFINEIIWKRSGNTSSIGQIFKRAHDSLLFYSKTNQYNFNFQRKPLSEASMDIYSLEDKRGRHRLVPLLVSGKRNGVTGRPWKGVDPNTRGRQGMHWVTTHDKLDAYEKRGLIVWPNKENSVPSLKYYLQDNPGVVMSDLWDDISLITSVSKEALQYQTQKPEQLLDRVIKTSSNEGELVLDCFCGSGTTAAVAEKLNRRWIACDLGRFAIHTSRKRLLQVSNVKPFTVQNLGKYERQAWQVDEFQSAEDQKEKEWRYRRFILELYKAEPISGNIWLHGIKNARMVHVGSVDAPITVADIKSIAAEVWKSVGKGESSARKAAVDVLGWEFAFDVNENAKQVAAEAKVDVTFKKIPREVLEKKAVEQGDIKFFELASLKVGVNKKGKEVKLSLEDFVVPPDDVPEEVRKSITHWSQWVDYWAVDWDYKDDTFHNQWQAFRTKKDASLDLTSAFTYEKAGDYTVLVKVIDILGNDTTKTIQIKVK